MFTELNRRDQQTLVKLANEVHSFLLLICSAGRDKGNDPTPDEIYRLFRSWSEHPEGIKRITKERDKLIDILGAGATNLTLSPDATITKPPKPILQADSLTGS